MEVAVKEYKGSKTIHRVSDFDGGYDPINGFYLSNRFFKADFEHDLTRLNLSTLVCNSHYLKHLDDRNTDDIFRIVSLKSLDGTNETQSCPPQEEKPQMFSYTPAYHSSPVLKKLCDWFECEKARIRIFRQLPGQDVQLHHDFDNERCGFDPNNLTVRIIVNLSDTDSYFQLLNKSCNMTVKMQKGQFMIINTDTIWHATRNNDTTHRDTLNMIVKWNDWLKDLTRASETLEITDVNL
jgi:hypothetical protein